VDLVDLRVERLDIPLLYVPIHHLRGFLDHYIHSSKGGQLVGKPEQEGG
jgi:hypothetical protein